MFDRDQWQEILSTLKKNKLRTFLTAFGVFWGIFMLVIMLGTGQGLQNGVLSEFTGFATNSIFMWTQKTSKPYDGLPTGRQYNFKNEDIQALKDKVPEIDVIAPQNQLGNYRGSNLVSRGIKSASFSVMGEEPQFLKIQPLNFTDGRFINKNDIDDKRKVAVIGDRVKELLFKKDETVLGNYIKINGVYFKVVGIFKSEKGGEDAIDQDQTVYIPFSTFQHAFNYGNNVGWFAITSKANIPITSIEDKIMSVLRQRHRIHPDDRQAIGRFNAEEKFNQMTGLFSGITILIWIVGTGTLLAGVIGVSNIMLIIVKERTKEIGIKRAIGATPFSIVRQILTESVFLTSVAGYSGLVAGIFIIELVSSAVGNEPGSMFVNPYVDLEVAFTSLTILIISGLLAGLVPASKAISITPVEALRSD